MTFHVPNQFRVRTGPLGSSDAIGNAGAFWIPPKPGKASLPMPLKVIASDGEGWEHVSVSLPDRCPTWAEMCRVKELFWDDGDCVVQFHPPRSEYVNNHPYCLHLWRKVDGEFETPPGYMVGYKDLGVLA